jgi:colicin import membrane protein
VNASMKTGTTISAMGHGLVLAWCLLSFSAKPYAIAPVDSVAVDVISENELSQLLAGSKTAPQAEKPKPVIDRIGEPHEPVNDALAKPVDKPPVQMAEASPPEANPPESKPPEAKPPEAKPPEAKPPEAKPPEAKPPEAKPPAPKPAESKPAAPPPAASEAKPDLRKSEPDPIAEALKREEAKKKEEAKKLEEAKRREEAKKREERKFDLAKIETALLDKRAPQRQAVTGSLVNPTPSLGAPAGNALALSQSEIDALRAQLMTCWNPPVGVADAKDLIVIVRFALNRDGSVSGEPTVVNRDANALFQVAAESATRAIRRCQPFRLPAAKYEAWRDVEVKFDPNDMFRG